MNRIFIVLIIGGLLIGGGIYLLRPQTEQPQPKVIPTPSPVANWQLYKNDRYGFSFKYPEGFEVKVVNDVDAQFLLSIQKADELYYLEVAPVGGMHPKYPLNRDADGTRKFGDTTWEYIPPTEFGDAGMSAITPAAYQIDNGKYRFDFKLKNPSEHNESFEAIVDSFELH